MSPRRGDVLLVDFRPGFGHEQQGLPRPCVVVSNSHYNARSNLVVVCPLTKRRKGRVFEVETTFQDVEGAVLVNQVRSIDCKARAARVVGVVDSDVLEQVLAKLRALLQ
jgi:mRNA interferase MazF